MLDQRGYGQNQKHKDQQTEEPAKPHSKTHVVPVHHLILQSLFRRLRRLVGDCDNMGQVDAREMTGRPVGTSARIRLLP
jgi:hypothetical protein